MRAGKGDTVSAQMARVPVARIPREHIAPFANLAWRANRPSLGLRATFPEIRRQYALGKSPRWDILTEHAACLVEIGAVAEAKRTLRSILDESDRAKFVLALLHFKEWDYASAIPLLESYLKGLPDDYHRLVTQVNLAAAYVVRQKLDEAAALLEETTQACERRGHHLLMGNCFEIRAQTRFFRGDHAGAERLLAQSEAKLAETKNMGWLYCKKWQLINGVFSRRKEGGPLASAEAAQSRWIQGQGRTMRSWETLREVDLFMALRFEDEELLNKVYFGSPFAKYRERIGELMQTYAPALAIRESVVRDSESRAGKPSDPIDLEALLVHAPHRGDGADLQSLLPKRLLLALSLDAYAPARTGQIFSELFGEDHFNPRSSPEKIFQLVKRLRQWLADAEPSLTVERDEAGYRLRVAPSRSLMLRRGLLEKTYGQRADFYLIRIREEFPSKDFSSAELGGALSLSKRSTNRILKDLEDSRRVIRIGRGPSTRFKLVA